MSKRDSRGINVFDTGYRTLRSKQDVSEYVCFELWILPRDGELFFFWPATVRIDGGSVVCSNDPSPKRNHRRDRASWVRKLCLCDNKLVYG